MRVLFDPTNVEHQRRRSKTFISDSDGELKLPGAYGTILAKVMMRFSGQPETAFPLLIFYILL